MEEGTDSQCGLTVCCVVLCLAFQILQSLRGSAAFSEWQQVTEVLCTCTHQPIYCIATSQAKEMLANQWVSDTGLITEHGEKVMDAISYNYDIHIYINII